MALCWKHLLLILTLTAALPVGGCGGAQKSAEKSDSAEKPIAATAASDGEAKPADVPKPETSSTEPNPSAGTAADTTAADTTVKPSDTAPTPAAQEDNKGKEIVPAPADQTREPAAPSSAEPSKDYSSLLFVFMLSTFIGLGVILRVSRLLHTPLMSLTNAISAIAVVGSIIVVGGEGHPMPIRIIGAIALFASMTNIISGFLITDRMLKMFKSPGDGGKR
jgi:H+-translocating NAD(P) transhydrogenase subunit alpha